MKRRPCGGLTASSRTSVWIPPQSLDAVLRDFEEQMEELLGPVGLRLYPDRSEPFGQFRMDDPAESLPSLDLSDHVLEKYGARTVDKGE